MDRRDAETLRRTAQRIRDGRAGACTPGSAAEEVEHSSREGRREGNRVTGVGRHDDARLAEVSRRVRKESMRVNAEFAAIEHA